MPALRPDQIDTMAERLASDAVSAGLLDFLTSDPRTPIRNVYRQIQNVHAQLHEIQTDLLSASSGTAWDDKCLDAGADLAEAMKLLNRANRSIEPVFRR
jgi:hypothetical protein